MKVSNLVEQIIAIAVALDQNGGLKNTVYAIHDEIFIMNYDHTVLLRFKLRKTETVFEHPISFKANDYDSNQFEEKDGKIIFLSEQDGYSKKKVCGTTDLTPQEVKVLFESYLRKVDDEIPTSVISKSVNPLLEDGLSHIEFGAEKGKPLKMIQRNIYSGGIIEIEKSQKGMLKETMKSGFGPVALKTSDFQALFSFQDQLRFNFPAKGDDNYIVVESIDDKKRNMIGIVACCLYDEVIELRDVSEKQIKKSKLERKK